MAQPPLLSGICCPIIRLGASYPTSTLYICIYSRYTTLRFASKRHRQPLQNYELYFVDRFRSFHPALGSEGVFDVWIACTLLSRSSLCLSRRPACVLCKSSTSHRNLPVAVVGKPPHGYRSFSPAGRASHHLRSGCSRWSNTSCSQICFLQGTAVVPHAARNGRNFSQAAKQKKQKKTMDAEMSQTVDLWTWSIVTGRRDRCEYCMRVCLRACFFPFFFSSN